MTAIRFVRVTLICERYENPEYTEHRAWPFWFDIIVDEKNQPRKNIKGYYFGGHQINGVTQLSNEEMYPARLDSKTGEVYTLFDDGDPPYYKGTIDLLDHPLKKTGPVILRDKEGGRVSIYRISDIDEAVDI